MIEVVLLTFLAAMLTALIGWLLLNELKRKFGNEPGTTTPRPGPATAAPFLLLNAVPFRPRAAAAPMVRPVFRAGPRKEFRARAPAADMQTHRLPVRCRCCGHYPRECRCREYARNNRGR